MMKLIPATTLLVALLATAGPSLASSHESRTPGASVSSSAPNAEMTAGEVRRIDKEQKKITLRHEKIKNLDMPAMSMVFTVRDPALLDKVAAGDKVRFRAEKIDGTFYVTAIEK